MKKKYFILIGIIVVLMLLIGYKKGDESEMKSEQLGGISINNTISINEKMDEYSLNELNSYFGKYSSQERSVFNIVGKEKDYLIETVNLKFPIQILRFNQNSYYSIYRVSEGGFFYVFWNQSADGIVVDDTFYICKLKDKSDFNDLQIGKSSYADVYEIDQASELMLLLSNGVYSYSLLENNSLLKIKYTFNDINGRNDLIIESIDVVSTKKWQGSFLQSILDKDLP